ncbi:MAG: thioredoxin family protein [Planctomycetota bacterium]|nr:thioredoxin family protein [Planctomycetota bacterium]
MTLSRPTRWLFALLAALVFAVPASAQPKPRAKLSTVLNATALTPGESAALAVVVDVDPGHHAQSRTPLTDNLIPFDVKLDANPAITVGEPIYPTAVIHDYGVPLGKLSVYEGKVIVYIPIAVKPDAQPGPLKLTGGAAYQICDDKVCYKPERPKFAIDTKVISAGEAVQPNQPDLFATYKAPGANPSTAPASSPATAPTTVPIAANPSTAPADPSSASPVVSAADEPEFTPLTAFGMALLAGLLFNVMPCVLPVLPLKAAAFHRAAEHHRSRSIVLGLAFSVGIIAVFAVLAVLVLVLRVISWGSLFSNPWFVWGIVILLLICAASMFDVFTFQLPTALYSVDPRQDTVGGNFVFGAFTAILATPCTAPLLPPLLLWASTQPVYVGVPAMLLVGVGMALPYLILSATPELARKFPQTGPWSELFKQMMGFMLLAAAAYFGGGRLIHGPGFWWVVVVVVAVAALYLMARTVQLTDRARPVGISAALAVVMLGGSLWWTARITGLTQPAVTVAGAKFEPYSDASFQQLRDSGKPVLIKFTANWCATCQVIEGTVFRDAQVWEELKSRNFATLKVDLTDEDAPGSELLLKLNPAGGIPLTAIYTPGNDKPLVLGSVYRSHELLAALNKAANGAHASAE